MISEHNKHVIDSINLDELSFLYKIFKSGLMEGKVKREHEPEIIDIIQYIENKLKIANYSIPTDMSISGYELQRGQKAISTLGLDDDFKEKYEYKPTLFDNAIDVGITFCGIIVLALLYGIGEWLVKLWNNGILLPILVTLASGTGIYFGYRKGLFEKIKAYFDNKKEKNYQKEEKKQKLTKQKTNVNKEINTISKEKEQHSFSISTSIKNVAIYASIITMIEAGGYVINKNTNVFDNTIVGKVLDSSEIYCEGIGLFTRKIWNAVSGNNNIDDILMNGYYDVKNINYNTVNNNYANNYYEEGYKMLVGRVDDFKSWEEISEYWYGDHRYAKYLQAYNAHDGFTLKQTDDVFIPPLEKLIDYGNQKVKKR